MARLVKTATKANASDWQCGNPEVKYQQAAFVQSAQNTMPLFSDGLHLNRRPATHRRQTSFAILFYIFNPN
ncbi:hypothetical protein CRG49_008385 [Neisseria sp. N95_16]|uniref:Uncharacterized protein n=1 Tax=Neisseria brasiliensis TaxID=2666100 RepID=A0A5Q3RYG5_9NEIS|nr:MULTISPECIES: hypothetical protein [Neisseria]MRN37864.1 hypothetical protein [Neisseria brasiliensis]PJO09301.1 hypothetical protein CRG49_008385 [Neisseria sp. N95_16]PJO77928.1 hypothetical protein CWC45_07790 [Neisseria sp. N177_16]QGL24815.1 hypothetical protein GJV52_04280 [Neisseria brasiliensis]